ncbi:hypothetical protein N8I77_003773 [Diaporthe amygdali]|uniref:Major facilitator superfamily (MFS) profile domain-containing protein n=1 Tax=Phomopsis amygdali TaxID=1214568 RepID=A0AAD9W685_PHOAM|nr:hypothetical protein N8I77_003773 [Diaporthe amygdali]
MEESPWESQRPDSVLPHDSDMQDGLRMATEAMQAAADAITAATASFRRQTLLHEELSSRRTTSLPHRHPEDELDEPRADPPTSSSRGRVMSIQQLVAALSQDDHPQSQDDHNPEDGDLVSRLPEDLTPPMSRQDGHLPATFVQPPPRLSTQASRLSSTTRRMSHQNLRGSSRRTTLSEGSTLVSKSSAAGAGQWRMPPEAFHKALPSWPIQPVYEEQYPYTPEHEPYDKSRSSFFQDSEQNSRFSTTRWPLEHPPPGIISGGSKDVDGAQDEYFSPILRMGRYTYIRTDTGDLGTSLRDSHWQDQQSSSQSSRGKSRASISPAKPPPNRPYGFSASREVLFVAVIILAQVLMLAGLAQALVPQHIIGTSFPDTNPGSLSWYSAAYGLTSGSFVLPSGRLGDIFGHRKVFIIGFIWLGLWELVGGFSEYVQRGPSGGGTVFFIFCRAMQGIGAALLVPNGQAMIGRGYPPGPRKNVVMSLFGAAAPLGFVTGGAMASLFAQLVSWPWAFWTMAAVCIGLAGVSVLVLPSTEKTTRQVDFSLWKQIDGPGIFLGVSGLVLFNFAFNQAPIVSWSTPYTYFILIIGVLLLASFVYVELHASHPLVPIASMTPTTNFVLGCTGAGWACFSIWVYYALSFMEQLRGYSPLLASAALSLAPVSGLAASMLAGFLLGKKVKPYIILLMSMWAFFVGSLLWALAPVKQTYWLNSFIGVLIIPFGMDMSNPAASILLSNSMAKEHQGTAASLVVTTVNYSISLALGIAGSVEVAARGRRDDVLAGYRGAQYLGLGLGGLGLLLAAVFALRSKRTSHMAEAGAKAG